MITTSVFSKTLDAYNNGYRIIANKGGTRSSKTFSALQLLYQIMQYSKKQRIISTVSHSFPHLYGGAIRDFEAMLDAERLNIDRIRTITPRQYHINKTLHEFIGFDKPGKALGAARDILFINEANKLPFTIVHQLMQRTTETIFLDWNPSEEFWFDTEGFADRADCIVIDSNFLDNIQNISQGQIMDLKAAKQKALKEDKAGKRGYWWNWWQVYGLGLKGQLEGVVFQNWTTYKELPSNIDFYKMWVIDWGGADPTTYTELNFDGDNNRLYIRQHIYQPQIRNSELISYIHSTTKDDELVICDSARKDKIFELQMSGINAHKCHKYPGVKLDNIDSMQEFDIFVHENSKDAIDEFTKYKWATDSITGKALNEPEDKNDHCFTADTKIITYEGLKNIRDIFSNDYVLTSGGFKRVIKKFNNGLHLVNKYLIQLETFSISLSCTKDHLIKTDKGWIQISKLKSGMTVFLPKNLTEKYLNYTLKKDTFQEAKKGCILKYGSFIMDQLKKAFKFIISTEILGIIELKILILKKRANTKENTQKKDLKKTQSMLNDFMNLESKQQKHGINQKRVANGIKNKVLKHGLIENIKRLFVKFAEKNIKHDTQENLCIATQIVKHVHCEKEERKLVYDLMIDENHEYFANGLLVHNCIDPVGYGVEFYRKSIKPL